MWRNQQKGFFFSSFASICSTAPNQPTNQPTNQLQSSLPGLSKGRLLPNDHYELQSRRPGAPDQEPEIICTICEASNKRCVRLHHIFWPACVVCAYFVRSNSLVQLQQGDTTRRSILYLDRHDNQNAAEGGIISLCSLACSLASSASTCYAFGGSARSLTRLSHIHALMCAMQCASAYTRPPTHTHTHTHTLSSLWKSAFICYRGLENFKDLIADFCFASTERETPCQMAPEAETSTVTLRVRGYLKWDKQAAERGCDGFFFIHYLLRRGEKQGICWRVGGSFAANILHLLFKRELQGRANPRVATQSKQTHFTSRALEAPPPLQFVTLKRKKTLVVLFLFL